jgi:hypothetical protein
MPRRNVRLADKIVWLKNIGNQPPPYHQSSSTGGDNWGAEIYHCTLCTKAREIGRGVHITLQTKENVLKEGNKKVRIQMLKRSSVSGSLSWVEEVYMNWPNVGKQVRRISWESGS